MSSWKDTELTPNQRAALQGPAPCDDCSSRQRCTFDEVACKDFAEYLRSGKVLVTDRKPTATTFKQSHRDYQGGSSGENK